MLLVFSGRDRLQWDFAEKFRDRHLADLEPLRDKFEMHTIADANHILSDPAWVRELVTISRNWLDRVHPARV